MKRYLIPTLASLIVTFGLWLYTRDSIESLIIGLLTNLTFLVIEYFQVINQVSKYLETHKNLIESSRTVVAVAEKMRKLENRGSPIQKWISERALKRLDDKLTDLASERWTVESVEGFTDLAGKLFEEESCKREYRGTSVVTDFKAYWQTALGHQFQKITAQALGRGIAVKRVFILDSAKDIDDTAPLMLAQAKLNIHVRYLLRSEVPAGIPMLDFGIWDNHTAMQLSEARHEGSAFRATLLLNEAEVKHLADIFDLLFEAARKFEANVQVAHTLKPTASNSLPQ
jgi:hypothetical protein